ncbi:MAG: Calx-beta domain-containing protein [Thermoanaerobaculia bacterium]
MPKTLLALLLTLATVPANAAVHIWTGASSNLLSDASNWQGGSPANDAAAELVFPSGVSRLTITNDLPGLTVRSLSFTGAGYTLGGARITLASDAEITDSTTGPNTIDCDLQLTAGTIVRNEGHYFTSGLTLSGAIGGAGTLTKLGPGVVAFAGARPNTYSGETRALAGELRLSKTANVESIAGDLTISDAGFFRDYGRVTTTTDEQIRDSANIRVGKATIFAAGGVETIGPIEVACGATVQTSIASTGTERSVGTIILGGDITIVPGYDRAIFDGDFALAGTRTITSCEECLPARLRLFRDHTPASGLILRGNFDVHGSYYGPTIVESGTVYVANQQTGVQLRGGSFSGEVRSLLAEGGTIDADDLSRGVKTFGDLRLSRATTVHLGFISPGSKLDAGGIVDFGHATLLLDVAPNPRPLGTTYLIGANDGSQPIRAPFSGLPEGAVVNRRFRVSYAGGNGNDFTLTEIARYPTAVFLNADPTDGNDGDLVTLTAEVVSARPANGVVTNGTVTFREGSTITGTAALNASGVATITTRPGPGFHRYTASFPGDAELAPSESETRNVSIRAVSPTITSLEPPAVEGGTTATVTIRGTNFLPNGSVVVDYNGVIWEYVSPTEVRFTWDVPRFEADRTVDVWFDQPDPGPQSNSFPLLVKATPDVRSPLVFDATGVTGPVVPGGRAAWMSVTLRRINFTTVRERLSTVIADSDRDGLTRWEQTAVLPAIGIWLMADMTDGRILTGTSNGGVPPALPFPHAMFLRDEQGRYAHIILQSGETWELLWVRPGAGAWILTLSDASAGDRDRVANGYAVFHTSQARAVAGSAAPPAAFEPGDIIGGIDWDANHWFGDRVDAHLGESNGPGTLLLLSGDYFEREGAGVTIPVSVLRIGGTDGEVSVDYRTVDDTAIAGIHYEGAAGTLTFGPGEILKTAGIRLLDDHIFGGFTKFDVVLTPHGATIDGRASFGVIVADDDPPPQLSAQDMTVNEGDHGIGEVNFVVTLTGTTRVPVTAQWSYSNPDFGEERRGELTFLPGGPTSQTIPVRYVANEKPEEDRIVHVSVYSITNAEPQSINRTVIIKDDDVAELTILDAAVSESASEVRVRIAMFPYNQQDVTVKYTTASGSATAGADFTAMSGTATFGGNAGEVIVTIPLLPDTAVEGDEWFTVTLSDPTDARIRRGSATVLIADDETATLPTITVGAPIAVEGEPVLFQFHLSQSAQQEVRIRARTIGGSAAAGTDYVAKDEIVVIPANGPTQVNLFVSTINDEQSEEPETFTLVLSDPVGATLITPSAVATIFDDDRSFPNAVRMFMNGAQVIEGNAARFEVTLEHASTSTVTVDYATADQSAVAPGDYAAATGTLTFAPGETVKFMEIATANDSEYESDESFTLVLGNATNAFIATDSATARVLNDDPAPAPKGRAVRH